MHRSSGGVCGAVIARVMTGAMFTSIMVACGGADSPATGPDGQVHQGIATAGTFTVSPTSVTVVQGQSATATLTFTLKGKSPGTMTLAAGSMPAGLSASFSPTTLTGTGSSTVTLTATSSASVVSGASVFFTLLVGTDTVLLDGVSPQLGITVRNARPTVTVLKAGSGTGAVTSSPAGINCGASCSAQFDALAPITLTAVPAAGSAFTSWSGLCVGTAPTCTFTPNDFGNIITATFTSTAPAIALGIAQSPLTVQAGGSTTATLSLSRINGYADPINLAISAPSGLTVTANPTSAGGTSSTLTITAASGLAAGNYPVTITATGTGITQQSITVPVQVSLTGGGGSITFNYASCEAAEIPIWFAVQNGAGPWTRITALNNSFAFTLGATGGIATVIRDAADTITSVLYGSAAEIAAIAGAHPCGGGPQAGTKRINVSLMNQGNASQGVFATVIVGGAQFTRMNDQTNSFAMTNVPSGPRDLIAARINSAPSASRMIVRRNTNYGNNQNIPVIDFGGIEAFAPQVGSLTPGNVGGDQVVIDASLITANGASASHYTAAAALTATNIGFPALPDSLLQAGDFHSVFIAAVPASGSDYRFAALLTHSAGSAPVPISFGPRASGASVTSVATAPYLRLRAQMASQATYTAGIGTDFNQGGRTVAVSASAAYFGAAPTTWAIDIPDLSAAGYDPAWALKSGGTAWEIDAIGGDMLAFLGGNPTNNAQIIAAGSQSSPASFSVTRRATSLRRPRRP